MQGIVVLVLVWLALLLAWVERTPAMAAGRADRPHSLAEIVRMPAHPIPFTTPRTPRHGRPSARGRLVPFPHPVAAPPERSAA